ncbi:hypothetical protein RI129_000211 [Pyrocoelia pectoralis]|uniref:Uncharacterized protein n=1 Tax=Pyrocoelia pectoralis TaxID=417401 RepID=A0AAN7VIV9_9COLE
MFQLNDITNRHGTILDLVFSNTRFTSLQSADQYLVNIDHYHPPLMSFISLDVSNIQCLKYDLISYDFKNVDYSSLNRYLRYIDWDCMFKNLSLEQMVSTFYDLIHTSIALFVPVYRYKSFTYPVWFNAELKALIIRKKCAHIKYKKSGLLCDYELFGNLRADCKQLAKLCYSNYVNKIENNIIHNPKNFWKFVGNKKNSSNSLPVTMFLNDVSSSSGDEIVNLFAENFCLAYNKIPNGNIGAQTPSCNSNLLKYRRLLLPKKFWSISYYQ